MPTVQAVVALLEGERGYLEKKSNAQLDSKTANAGYNNYTKYTRDIDAAGINDARYQGQAWCCSLAIWPELHLSGAAEARERFYLPVPSKCKADTYFDQTTGVTHSRVSMTLAVDGNVN